MVRLLYTGLALAAMVGGALLLAPLLAAFGWLPGVHPNLGAPTPSDLASTAVAGATLLLADFTALLAWLTGRAIRETRREAALAEAALEQSRKEAEIATKALAAVEEQVTVAHDQVEATNRQATIAQQQFAANWRPLLADPRSDVFLEIEPRLDRQYGFQARMVNIGPGPAFMGKAFLNLPAAVAVTTEIAPSIVESRGECRIWFALSPTDGVDRAITELLLNDGQVGVTVLYHDVSRTSAWRSQGNLVRKGTRQWQLASVKVSEIGLEFLD